VTDTPTEREGGAPGAQPEGHGSEVVRSRCR